MVACSFIPAIAVVVMLSIHSSNDSGLPLSLQRSDAAQSSSPLFAPRARRVTPPSPLGLAFGPAYGFGASAAHLYSSPALSATSWPLLDVEVLAYAIALLHLVTLLSCTPLLVHERWLHG